MFQLRCSVIWGLRPRSFPSCFCSHVPSCSSPHQCLSHTSRASGMCSTFLPWFLTSICDSGFSGPWGPQVPAVGSEASMLSPQPSASYSPPRQFHLEGIRDVSQNPVPASALHCSHVPTMALESLWFSGLDVSRCDRSPIQFVTLFFSSLW